MIRNIIFDMGRVLIGFDPEYYIRNLGYEGEKAALLLRHVFSSVEWVQMDRGSLTDEEALARMQGRLPESLHAAARTLVMEWDKPLLVIPGMTELIRELKEAGYGIYLLSNASRRQHAYWPRIPSSIYFDGTLISADHLLTKPQHEIYEKLFATFGLDPSECYFVDDAPVNIEGALMCGMEGFLFRGDADELRHALVQKGIPIADATHSSF